MNVNELFVQYEDRLHSADDSVVDDAIFELLDAVHKEEQAELANGMKFHEMVNRCNNMWNAIVELDIQKNGTSNLRYNGYSLFSEIVLFKHVNG